MSDSTPDEKPVWTNIYLQFALSRADRERLDAYLRTQDISIGMGLRKTIVDLLDAADVSLFESKPNEHHHH